MIENDSYAEVINEMLIDSQSAAICLALTNTIKSEDLLKKMCHNKGYRCAVTEFGGNGSEFSSKVIGHIIAACLNKNIIKRNVFEMHAVIHAAEEAARGFLAHNNNYGKYSFKDSGSTQQFLDFCCFCRLLRVALCYQSSKSVCWNNAY